MALQGDASALNKLTVMAMLPGQLQQQAQQLLSGMQGIRATRSTTTLRQWAYQHPKAATAGLQPRGRLAADGPAQLRSSV
jgi:hypothetical protein